MGSIFSSGSNSNVQLPTQGPQGERGPPGPAGPPGNAASLIGSQMFSTAVNSQIQDSLTTLQDSIFYCDPLKDYCSLPKKGIIQGDLDIKGILNVNDKLKINSDGSVDNFMTNSLTSKNILIKGNSVWTIEEQTNDGNQLCFKQDGKTRMCLGGKNTKIWAGYDGDGKGRYMYFANEGTTYVKPSDIGIRNKGTNTTWPSDF
jgi:hypothetical protein